MRVLTVSSFYPPNVIGGAEICARNLSHGLIERGHDVAVLTAAPTPADQLWGERRDGVTMFRVATPHLYPVAEARAAAGWRKPVWHLQDVLDPRNRANFERTLDAFRPDMVHIHWIQGLGYNGLSVFARRDLPVAITFHDLAYVCLRTTMFRDGHECERLCRDCALSARIKRGLLDAVPRLGFIAPSRAILDQVAKFLPIGGRPRFHIPNPNRYPRATVAHAPSDRLRLLFVGRLEQTKGINFLLALLAPLAERARFSLTVLGKGPEEDALRARYGDAPWLKIAGHVPLQTVADEMATADLCLMPSLWAENSPGVLFQALAAGLPVMASDKGGLPELIRDGQNGYLLPAGDAAAWTEALTELIEDPGRLAPLRTEAARSAAEFDYDRLVDRMVEAYRAIADRQPAGGNGAAMSRDTQPAESTGSAV